MKKKINSIKIFAALFLLLSSSSIYTQNDFKQVSDSLSTLCKKFYNEGLFKDAVDVYKDTGFEKLSAEGLFYVGSSYNNLRATIKASQYFRRAVELAPGHNGYRLHLSRLLSQLGKIDDAISNYNFIIQSDSNNAAALFELGLLHFDKRDYNNSIRLFTKLVKLNEGDFLSNYYLGYSKLLTPNPAIAEQATADLKHAVALNPDYLPAVSLLASNQFSLQKYYEANALYNIARKLRPENADFHYKSGLCSERLKFYRDAANLYSKAASLDSNDANYFDHLGFVYFNMSMYDSAVAAYKIAASLDNSPTYYVNLGFTYARMDSIKKSIAAFQKALQLMPFDKIGNIYSQIAAVHYSKQNLEAAKAAYEKTLIYNPSNIDAQFYIAMINEKLLDWRNASLAYKKVIKLAGDDSTQTERINYSKKKLKELKRK